MTTDRARIGGGKRGEKENKAPAPKRTVTPGYTPQSGPTLPIPLTPHRVKETGFTPSFFCFFVPSLGFCLFTPTARHPAVVVAIQITPPNDSAPYRRGALLVFLRLKKKRKKVFPLLFFFLLVGHLITAQPGRITLDCEVFSVFSVPSSRFLFT